MLNKNVITEFLDDPSMSEDKLSEEAGSDGFLETMLKVLFPDSGGTQLVKTSRHHPWAGDGLVAKWWKEDRTHAFYTGKLSEKLGLSHEISFSYYNEAIALNPSAVDPFYRMHASCLKLLGQCGKQKMGDDLRFAEYCWNRETRDNVLNLFGKIISQTPLDVNVEVTESNLEDKM
ncbi:hypothetical protein QQ045_012922 [Rhodiola kirilowii]